MRILSKHKRNLEYNNKERLESNIIKNYVYTFLMNFNVTNGVWMLYLAYRGLNLFEIGIMEAIFHISSFTMEIPTGIIADLLGRKTSRSLGRLVGTISMLMMIYSSGLVGFSISFIFHALSYNLESGAGDALIYDSMKEVGIENKYMKFKGRFEVVFQVSSALALPIGGYLATLDYGYVYKLALVVAFVSFLYSLAFVEPSIGKVEKKKNGLESFLSQFTQSFMIIKKDRQLSFFIIMAETFGVFSTTTFFYIQNMLKENGRSEFRIGLVLAIGAFLSAIGASLAHKIEKRYAYKKTLRLLLVAAAVFLWFMTSKNLSELGIIGLGVVEAIEYVIMSDYINKLIPSEKRATILSMQSMVFSLFMIILFPMVGFLGDLAGLHLAFVMIGVFATMIIGLLINRISKEKVAEPCGEE